MKVSDLLLESDLFFVFLDFIKLGEGSDTPGRVSSPPPCIIEIPCDMLHRSIK